MCGLMKHKGDDGFSRRQWAATDKERLCVECNRNDRRAKPCSQCGTMKLGKLCMECKRMDEQEAPLKQASSHGPRNSKVGAAKPASAHVAAAKPRIRKRPVALLSASSKASAKR